MSNDDNQTTKKKYKALMLDVDGTLVENKRDGMPSKKVTDAIAKAREKVHVGIVTGRPLFFMHELLDHLQFSGPVVVDAGTAIIDAKTRKVLWEKTLLPEDMGKVLSVIEPYKEKFEVSDNYKEFPLPQDYVPNKLFGFFSRAYTLEQAAELEKNLSEISTVIMHRMISWDHPDLVDIYITHAEVSKQHALIEVSKLLDIDTQDMIGVGDGYNDFPLLMACGLKVAMGNAIPDLKVIADYVAPTVQEDGLVDVIEKFIL